MKAVNVAASILLASLASSNAIAEEDSSSARWLAQECRVAARVIDAEFRNADTISALSFGLCAGYVSGVIEANPHIVKCVPNNSTTEQHIRVFNKWADNNPELLHLPRVLGLGHAIASAYNCGQYK